MFSETMSEPSKNFPISTLLKHSKDLSNAFPIKYFLILVVRAVITVRIRK